MVYDAYKDDIFEDVISEELLGPDISFVDMSHDQWMKRHGQNLGGYKSGEVHFGLCRTGYPNIDESCR